VFASAECLISSFFWVVHTHSDRCFLIRRFAYKKQPELYAQDELFRLLNVDPSKKNHATLDVEAVREIVKDYPKIFLVKNRFAYGEFVRKLLPIFNLVALQAPVDLVEAAFAASPFSIMDELDSSAQSVVHYACRYHAPLESLEFLCMVNVTSLQLRDSQGYTPLHTAVSCHAPLEIIEFLVERNPDAVRIPDKSGGTPIHCACQHQAPLEVVQALLNSLKKPENAVLTADNEGWTPLHVAAANNADLDVMELLIETAPSVTELRTNPPPKEPKEKDHPEDEDDAEVEEEEEDEEDEPEGELALDIARSHQADADVIRLLVKSTPGATFRVGERLAKSKRKAAEKNKVDEIATSNEKTLGMETARDAPEGDDDEEDNVEANGALSCFCCSRRKHQSAVDDDEEDEEEDEEEEGTEKEEPKETAK
jgi:ankyrin repeat protein